MRPYTVLSAALLLSMGCASAPPAEAPPPKTPPQTVTPMVGGERAPGGILYLWTQLVSGGTRYPGKTMGLARAVVSGQGQTCPAIQLDDLPGVPMTARPNPLPGMANYPITVCEHPLVRPDGRPAGRAQVADRLLPLSGTIPARIAVLGDTGCRDDERQRCDEAHWPFEQVAKTVARRQSPTLVINVGDYRYRQNDRGCESGCASPTWDNWQGWEDDFFKPAAELLQVAPWLMIRGNHEDCDLTGKNGNGRGWFYLLDPSSTLLGTPLPTCGPDPKTPTYAPSYAVDVALGGGATQRLIVLDTADAPDDNPPAPVVQIYRDLLKTVGDLAQQGPGPAWLVTHRPVWGVKNQACGKPPEVMNATLQQASGGRLPRISLILAAHLHLFQSLSFGAGMDRPPVVIMGISGSALSSSPVQGRKEGTFSTSLDGGDISAGFLEDFGFLMLNWDGSGSWQATVSSPDGDQTRRCRFQGATFDCGFPAVDPCEGTR